MVMKLHWEGVNLKRYDQSKEVLTIITNFLNYYPHPFLKSGKLNNLLQTKFLTVNLSK
jgi:hypothetical protein